MALLFTVLFCRQVMGYLEMFYLLFLVRQS